MTLGSGPVHLLVRACADGDHPRPDSIREGASVWFDGELDVTRLVESVEAELHPDVFELDANLSHLSWGADGVLLEVVIGLTTGVMASRLDRLIEVVGARLKRQAAEPLDASQASAIARTFVCQAKSLDEEAVTVDRVDQRSASFLVIAKVAPGGDRYEVEVPARGGVSRFHRL
jgi:hypothetical protein